MELRECIEYFHSLYLTSFTSPLSWFKIWESNNNEKEAEQVSSRLELHLKLAQSDYLFQVVTANWQRARLSTWDIRNASKSGVVRDDKLQKHLPFHSCGERHSLWFLSFLCGSVIVFWASFLQHHNFDFKREIFQFFRFSTLQGARRQTKSRA